MTAALDLLLEFPTTEPDRIVVHNVVPPLTGTFERCEAECAAACMVIAAQMFGDWRDVTLKDIAQALRENPPAWDQNPFVRPDFHDLVNRGFAKFAGRHRKKIRFTPKGLDRLLQSRWWARRWRGGWYE
jgi:hypothetical protein